MVSVLLTIGGTVMNLVAFCGINFFFRKLMNHGEEEQKRHDLAQTSGGQRWMDRRLEPLDFINKSLHQKDEAKAYFNNDDRAMVECYWVFAKQWQTLLEKHDFEIRRTITAFVHKKLMHIPEDTQVSPTPCSQAVNN